MYIKQSSKVIMATNKFHLSKYGVAVSIKLTAIQNPNVAMCSSCKKLIKVIAIK